MRARERDGNSFAKRFGSGFLPFSTEGENSYDGKSPRSNRVLYVNWRIKSQKMERKKKFHASIENFLLIHMINRVSEGFKIWKKNYANIYLLKNRIL